jgi:hypothetical protein
MCFGGVGEAAFEAKSPQQIFRPVCINPPLLDVASPTVRSTL